MRTIPRAAGAAILALAPLPLAAQGIPFGSEVVVNTYTTASQEVPAVSSDGAGRFVVVWTSLGQDGSGSGIFGQRFAANGAKTGAEFQINTSTSGYQQTVSVATDPFGRSIAVWTNSPSGVAARRFDATGGFLGSEFQVNTYTTGLQTASASSGVATDADGNFVVVWNSDQDGSSRGVFGQRFDATGAKVGAEFRVNTTTAGDQSTPAIAMSPAGSFAVVWVSAGQDGSDEGIFGQRFDPAGDKAGPEFRVNTYTTSGQLAPSVAMGKAGEFVVVWTGLDQDGSQDGTFGQRFNASAEKIGPEFQVNSTTSSYQKKPSVAMDGSGAFFVAWSNQSAASGRDVFAQRFDRAGSRVGSEFRVNTYTTSSQTDARVASDGLGFVVAWDSNGQDQSSYGIVARRQNLLALKLFVDTDPATGTSSDTNGVLEPGETVLVAPEWKNVGAGAIAVSGTASGFTGPAGPAYSLTDAAADYGTIFANGSVNCFDGNSSPDCYLVGVSGARPAVHWDARLTEDLATNGGQPWTIHVGQSFTDVPKSQPFYAKIETILHAGITAGCGGTLYCPGSAVPRDQMAIFIAKAIAGSGELVPAAGTVGGQPYRCAAGGASLFADVGVADSFCKHVHYIAAQNVTLGCGPSAYCPSDPVTRDAMASFIAKAILAPDGGPAVPVTYGPDPQTGLSYSCAAGSPVLHFTDVPASNPFCKHIHYLWARGIVSGCSATLYCPTQSVTRDAMAKFLANAFALQLYGP